MAGAEQMDRMRSLATSISSQCQGELDATSEAGKGNSLFRVVIGIEFINRHTEYIGSGSSQTVPYLFFVLHCFSFCCR
jgi:hypothetical protein